LIGIIEPEEERVMVLRDAFDAKVQAEKDAKIAAERARIEGIQKMIGNLRDYPRMILASDPACLSLALEARIAEFDGWVPHEDDYAEFVPQAAEAIAESLATMRIMMTDAIAKEAEAARQQAEREAAAAQAQKEREELAAAQAELKRQQAEQAAEMQKQRDAMATEMKAEREKAEAIRKLEDDQRKFVQQQERDKLEAANAEMRLNMAKLADQERELNARRDADNAERLAAARKLEEETAAVAVVESPQIAIDPMRPTDDQIAWTVAEAFSVGIETAIDWIASFGK
jgi:DNA repair exonuclease SbcCD ATPase subunit